MLKRGSPLAELKHQKFLTLAFVKHHPRNFEHFTNSSVVSRAELSSGWSCAILRHSFSTLCCQDMLECASKLQPGDAHPLEEVFGLSKSSFWVGWIKLQNGGSLSMLWGFGCLAESTALERPNQKVGSAGIQTQGCKVGSTSPSSVLRSPPLQLVVHACQSRTE